MDKQTLQYYRRAKIVAALMQLAPFVRMVLITGSLSRGKVKIDSDIDFLIITCKDRLWTARLFTQLLLKLTGLKVDIEHNKIGGRICLNLYQTENRLLISPQNRKVARAYYKMQPLWGDDNLYRKLLKANRWMKKYYSIKFKNQFNYSSSDPIVIGESRSLKSDSSRQARTISINYEIVFSFWRRLIELLIDIMIGKRLEWFARRKQIAKIQANTKKYQWHKTRIFISDAELRLHG